MNARSQHRLLRALRVFIACLVFAMIGACKFTDAVDCGASKMKHLPLTYEAVQHRIRRGQIYRLTYMRFDGNIEKRTFRVLDCVPGEQPYLILEDRFLPIASLYGLTRYREPHTRKVDADALQTTSVPLTADGVDTRRQASS